MECHIEQVLYRDQRTIKTRYFDASKPHHQQACPSCQNNHQKSPLSSENQRFLSYSSPNNHQVSSFSNFDGALSIHAGASPSSLDTNCHNQYFSKFKRLLNLTDLQCECKDVSFSGVSKRRKRGLTSWFKKFQNVLLLGTYFSLLSFSNTHALPANMGNRNENQGFWANPCGHEFEFEINGEPPKEMNLTYISNTRTSVESALDHAKLLKDRFRTESDSNPEETFAGSNYSWMPNIPERFDDDDAFNQHASSLQWPDSLLTMFKHLQTISVPLEEVTQDFQGELLEGDLRTMQGLMSNVLCDLQETIASNNLKITETAGRDVMPSYCRGLRNRLTERLYRDWVTLRELVRNLEYTLAICKYLERRTQGTIS